MKQQTDAYDIATGFGWFWTDAGPVVTVQSGKETMRVLVPIQNVWVVFSEELAKEGCAMPRAVGDYSVGGLFSGIKRAVRKGKRAVRKGARSVNRATRGIRRAKRRITRTAKRYGRKGMNLARRGAKAYLKTNPVLQQSLKLQRRFGNNPLVQTGLSAFPPAAAANQALTMSNKFLRGERVNPFDAASLAAAYVPGGAAVSQGIRTARQAQRYAQTARDVSRGNYGRALSRHAGPVARRYGGQVLQHTPEGAQRLYRQGQTAALAYRQGQNMTRGQLADMRNAKRLRRAVKKRLLREVRRSRYL